MIVIKLVIKLVITMNNPIISKNLYISYKTDDATFVGFGIEIGKGIDSSIEPSVETMSTCDIPYDIEMYKSEGKNQYRVIAEEGPFIIKINKIEVISEIEDYKYNYEYGIRVVVDLNNEPKYNNTIDCSPYNSVERDGIPWDLESNKTYNLDQNGCAKFMWSTERFIKYGIKSIETKDEIEDDEKHQNSGLFFITSIPIVKKTLKPEYLKSYNICKSRETKDLYNYRGAGILKKSYDPQIWYGYISKTKTNTSKSDFYPIHDGRFILPVRFRIANKDNIGIKP